MTSPARHILTKRTLFSKRNITIALLFMIGVALFLTIYDGVQEHEGLAMLDGPLRAWMAENQNTRMTTAMHLISTISSPTAISFIALIGATIWYWRTKDYWRPILATGAVALALVSSAIIKVLTARERPTITDLVDANGAVAYSFPSGHTIGAAVLLFVIAYFVCTKAPTLQRIISWILIVMTDIALVALSRIYLGYHWLTDVTASVGLALVILAIVIAVDTYAPTRHRSTSKAA
jgi:undecaprenyl-diphosphatase